MAEAFLVLSDQNVLMELDRICTSHACSSDWFKWGNMSGPVSRFGPSNDRMWGACCETSWWHRKVDMMKTCRQSNLCCRLILTRYIDGCKARAEVCTLISVILFTTTCSHAFRWDFMHIDCCYISQLSAVCVYRQRLCVFAGVKINNSLAHSTEFEQF